jgi:hypothetical protein
MPSWPNWFRPQHLIPPPATMTNVLAFPAEMAIAEETPVGGTWKD